MCMYSDLVVTTLAAFLVALPLLASRVGPDTYCELSQQFLHSTETVVADGILPGNENRMIRYCIG